MSPEFCTDLTWIEDHIRSAIPGARCEVVGSEGLVVQTEGGRPGLAGVRLIGEGFEAGTMVYVRYQTRSAECGFYAKVRAARSGQMLLEQPGEIMVIAMRAAA
jgi:hypothetical protein